MNKRFFIAGTDTSIGKTTVACSLLYALQQQGYSTLGLKPVASGCQLNGTIYRNNDALALQQWSSVSTNYEDINPFAFEKAIAPHIAADLQNTKLSVLDLLSATQETFKKKIDYILVEGCGGWLVPLNQDETFADFARALQFPVILIVGMRLGCLNHALLTVESIQNSHLPIVAWIANCIDPDMEYVEENIGALQNRISAPLMGIIPYQTIFTMSEISEYLDLQMLLID